MRAVRISVVAATMLAGVSAVAAAELRDVGEISVRSVSLPGTMTREAGKEPSAAPLARAIGLDAASSLRLLRTTALPGRRGRALRFRQLYRGVPIWDQQVVVRQTPGGALVDASGTAIFDIAADRVAPPKPGISADRALAIGVATVASKARLRQPAIDNPTAELVYRLDGKDGLELVYKVSFFTTVEGAEGRRPTRPILFVDATSGAIVETLENIQFAEAETAGAGEAGAGEAGKGKVRRAGTGPGGNARVGRYRFGTGIFPKLTVTVRGDGTCAMDSPFLMTEDLEQKPEGDGKPYTYRCFDNVEPKINGGYGPLNDAHTFGEVVYDLYTKWYDTRPLPGKLLQRAHYDEGYDRAFWNGEAMYYGDGKTLFYPVVSLDVAGHEISHGFTEHHSGLVYENQSGAMNEAYSDMAAQATMAYFATRYGQPYRYDIPNFKIGTSIWKEPGKSYRYMCNPPADGRSIDHVRDYRDGMDVHLSSGIYNKAFCLLAKSRGWNTRKAFEVFLVANGSYWVPRSTFETGARDVLRAARMLDYPTDAIAAAFGEVGVGLPVLRVGLATNVLSGTGDGRLDTRVTRIRLSSAAGASWEVSGLPAWLRANRESGVAKGGSWLRLSLTPEARRLRKDTTAVLIFRNTTQAGQAPLRRRVRFVVEETAAAGLE